MFAACTRGQFPLGHVTLAPTAPLISALQYAAAAHCEKKFMLFNTSEDTAATGFVQYSIRGVNRITLPRDSIRAGETLGTAIKAMEVAIKNNFSIECVDS